MKLKYPVEVDGQTVTEINLRRAKAKDLRALEAAKDGEGIEETFLMLSILSGQPVAVIEDLDLEDFTPLAEKIADFFPKAEAPANGDP